MFEFLKKRSIYKLSSFFKRGNGFWSLLISLLIHLSLAILIFVTYRKSSQLTLKPSFIQVEIKTFSRTKNENSSPQSSKRGSSLSAGESSYGVGRLGLPHYVKPNERVMEGDHRRDRQSEEGAQLARDLLTSESKEIDVFDRLAKRINGHLEYPEMFIENGVQGSATLVLYFDSKGEVDEDRSKTGGDHILVRGLLTRAIRKALVDWYANEASHLRKEQFKKQSFRADFLLNNSKKDNSDLMKLPGSYTFLRRRFSNVACLGGGFVDIACAAFKVGGAIHRSVSDKYKNQFTALKDTLDYYDGLGLRGINEMLRLD